MNMQLYASDTKIPFKPELMVIEMLPELMQVAFLGIYGAIN